MRRTFLPAPSLPEGRPRLVLAGFMGTGKTTAGRAAARRLGLPFFDLDEVAESRAGMAISQVFARAGETQFRVTERQAVQDAARLSGAVVAAGGGAVLDKASFGLLASNALVVVLTCEAPELTKRLLPVGDRPLLEPDLPTRVRQLMEERADAYDSAGESLDTTRVGPDRTAAELASRYSRLSRPEEPARIDVDGPEGSYPVLVGTELLDRLGEELAGLLPSAKKATVVADGAVAASLGARVARGLRLAGLYVTDPIALAPGEAAKSLASISNLWSGFRAMGLEPTDLVVAVGGGATLDAAGFAAATYARGVPLVNVPTTLLGMVDAAVGGKVGIDHAGVKNLVGAFHHPRLVAADLTVLRSVPPRVLRSGLAEVVKAGLLASPLVPEALTGIELDRGDGDTAFRGLAWAVEQAVRIKAGYVALDPRDRLLRRSLNLGHTFAHAIEAASGYRVQHGEAVATGLVAAARLGERLGSTPPGLVDGLEDLLSRLRLPTEPPPGLDANQMLEAMKVDKKRRSGAAVFVVPAEGGAELLEGVEPDMALKALTAHDWGRE